MGLTLYGAPLSPFVRKVRLCLMQKALDYQLEMINPFRQPDWYVELNPLRRVPALKHDDLVLADSSVICQYLEDLHPTPALYGNTPAQRARVRWLEKYCDYELAPHSTFAVFFQRLIQPTLGQRCDEQIVALALNEQLPGHFDYLENTLGESTWFVGDHLTMADIAFACQLVNMAHGGEQLDPQRWPRLSGHFARLCQLPSLAALLEAEQRSVDKIRQIS